MLAKVVPGEKSLWSWSFDNWIYNYICNNCLSALTFLVRIPLMVRCTLYNIMWSTLPVTIACRWYSPVTPVSSTNKTARHEHTWGRLFQTLVVCSQLEIYRFFFLFFFFSFCFSFLFSFYFGFFLLFSLFILLDDYLQRGMCFHMDPIAYSVIVDFNRVYCFSSTYWLYFIVVLHNLTIYRMICGLEVWFAPLQDSSMIVLPIKALFLVMLPHQWCIV